MFAEDFPDRDSFQQCLRCNLEKLEQELVQAHLQVLQSLHPSGPNGIQPLEQVKETKKLGEFLHQNAQDSGLSVLEGFAIAFSQNSREKNAAPRSPPKKHCGVDGAAPKVSNALPASGSGAHLPGFQELPVLHENTDTTKDSFTVPETPRMIIQLGESLPTACNGESGDLKLMHASDVQDDRDVHVAQGIRCFPERPTAWETIGSRPSTCSTTQGSNLCGTGGAVLRFEDTDEARAILLSEGEDSIDNESNACGDNEPEQSQSILPSQGETPSERVGDQSWMILRPIWQDTQLLAGKGRRKSRFGQKVNNALAEIDKSKKRKRLSFSKRFSNRFSNSSNDGASRSSRSVKCVIIPFSRGWINWELFGMMLLLHDIIFVPMQVFKLPPTPVLDTLKWVTIIYWTLTFFLTFFVTFQRNSEAVFVTDHRQIVIHYLKGWFVLDFFLVTSDWLGIAIEIIIDTTESGLRNARMARMARLGRLFRIIRLLRLMRIGEMLQRVESLIDSEYLSICFLICCNLVAILFLAHLAACIWFGIGDGEEGTTNVSWLTPLNLQNVPIPEQYMHSLGWSLSTLLGASVTEPYAPQTIVEYNCALVILITGTIAVSLVFSSTTAAMTRLQQLKSEDRDATYKLKKFLRQNCISGNLEARLVRYVDIAKSVHSKRIASDKVTLLNLLSGPLRLELQLELHAPHLTLHRFFNLYHVTNAGAMSQLCLTAVGFVYLGRYDALFRTFSQANHMYFLVGGVMAYRRAKGARKTPHVVKVDKNNNFCEPTLWTVWVHRGGMQALIESQVLALDVNAFCDITEAHHDIFCQACEYAERYLIQMKEQTMEYGYIWDIPSEIMYQKQDFDGRGFEDVGFLNILNEAEEVSAELMDGQSDSDSEDERMLKSALQRSPSKRLSTSSAVAGKNIHTLSDALKGISSSMSRSGTSMNW